jgi:hypothetical protein
MRAREAHALVIPALRQNDPLPRGGLRPRQDSHADHKALKVRFVNQVQNGGFDAVTSNVCRTLAT